MGKSEEKCKEIKNDILLSINDLPDEEEYLLRLKKFINFKLKNKSNTD